MEALAKDQLSSDSEDEDYVPPEVKQPALTLRKKTGGLELESDDEDDDDLSDDADLVDVEVAQLYASGAGPSSAGAGPSSAAGSSAAAGGSSVAAPSAAGGSSAAAGSSSADAGSISAVAQSSGPSAGASSSADARAEGASSGADGSVKIDDVVDGIVATETEKIKEADPGAEADIEKAEGEAVDTGSNGAQSVEPVTKKPRVEKPKGNQSVDDIWADMNAGVTRKKEPTAATDVGLAAWLEPQPTKKKEFKITRLADLEKAVKRGEPSQKKKGRTGLEGVLDVVRGKTDTVITKTKEQWKEFKKDDEVSEELEKYKKDKNRYTDKVAFLQRSDVREWEYEQKGKKRR